MLCNSLATWFAILYKRAVFLSPYHITAKAFFRNFLSLNLIVVIALFTIIVKKAQIPQKAAQYEEQVLQTKVSKSHVLSHYLRSSPPNTLHSYTTYRNQEKYIYACMSHIQVASLLLTVRCPSSSWVCCFCSRRAAVVRCANDFSRSHFPESFSSIAKRTCVSKCDFFFLCVYSFFAIEVVSWVCALLLFPIFFSKYNIFSFNSQRMLSPQNGFFIFCVLSII